MSRIPVYFIPGLAASSKIFEWITLPDEFEPVALEWELPLPGEDLKQYCVRYSKKITHPNPVLIGVSFGGLIVQELARLIPVRRVIIISSAKCIGEYPRKFKLGRTTGLYKLMPVRLFIKLEKLAKFHFWPGIDQRLQLYKRYMGVRDRHYWEWAIEQVVKWDRTEADPNVIHNHGDHDHIFPFRYIKNCISIKGGTHIMLITRYKWFNEYLPKLILDGRL